MKCENMKPQTLYSRDVDYVNYENLANAIVLQAVNDYKAALRILLRNPDDGAAQHDAWCMEKFFYSQWYGMLTSLAPDRLIKGVKELVENEEADKLRKRMEKDETDTKRIIKIVTALGGSVDANLHRYLNPSFGWTDLLLLPEHEDFDPFANTIFEPPELEELFGRYKEGEDVGEKHGCGRDNAESLPTQGVLAGSLVFGSASGM